jgi:hypothetical protein
MAQNGWSDLAQHLTVDPQGWLWTGRNRNLAPASATGHNGTAGEGPLSHARLLVREYEWAAPSVPLFTVTGY